MSTIKVSERPKTGKGASKKLRKSGKIPAVLYGRDEPTKHLLVDEKEFTEFLKARRGHSAIVDLVIDNSQPVKCLIKSLQRDPVSLKLLHIDFQKIHPREKISFKVPVHLTGSALGVKAGGLLDYRLREIPIRAELEKIPETIDIDITNLKIGQSVHLADLKFPDVEYLLALDTPIVSVLPPKKVVEAAPVTVETKEPEVITEKKKEEPEEAKEEKKEKKTGAT